MQSQVDYSYVLTGSRSKLPQIKNRISNIANRCTHFYIGLTNHPERRFADHVRKGLANWDRMVVLYQTSSARKEGDFEDELIAYYRESKYASKLINSPLSGGREGRMSEPPCYIYVLVED